RGARMSVGVVRGDAEARDAAMHQLGGVNEVSLVGPFSPFHLLSWDESTPVSQNGSLAGPFTSAFGPLPVRTVHAPDGRMDLTGEPGQGDLYLQAFDADVTEPGLYVARTVSGTSHQVLMDGAPLMERRAWERAASTVTSRAVQLPAGKHRFVVRQLKGGTSGLLTFALLRVDGRPSACASARPPGPRRRPGAARPRSPTRRPACSPPRRA
ncbi:hypothetical protein ACLEPN_21800, partial [Myxococcus sp. 1LA]